MGYHCVPMTGLAGQSLYDVRSKLCILIDDRKKACAGKICMIEYLRDFKDIMVYRPMLRQQYRSGMVGKYHTV